MYPKALPFNLGYEILWTNINESRDSRKCTGHVADGVFVAQHPMELKRQTLGNFVLMAWVILF